MSARELAAGNTRANLCTLAVTTALSAVAQTPVIGIVGAKFIALYANFVYGSGGTTADVYIQSSIDGGVTWFDIANFHFTTASAKKMSTVVIDPATPLPAGTTPGSAALAANTVLNGIIGDRIRALVTTVGTYAASTLTIDMVSKS